MFKKTIVASVVGLGSLAALAVPASADSPGTDQIGLVNVNDTLNNLCALPWNDGNVLAVEVPILSPNEYQACNEGKTLSN